jgi:predicted TIM-barrel fold metal-dependent hydrolase
MARMANDELAELVIKYPDRFAAGVATLPMNDMDAALREADRAIRGLQLKGVQIFSSINGKPLDLPMFFPLYEKMVGYDLPIWLHPEGGLRLQIILMKRFQNTKYGLYLAGPMNNRGNDSTHIQRHFGKISFS